MVQIWEHFWLLFQPFGGGFEFRGEVSACFSFVFVVAVSASLLFLLLFLLLPAFALVAVLLFCCCASAGAFPSSSTKRHIFGKRAQRASARSERRERSVCSASAPLLRCFAGSPLLVFGYSGTRSGSVFLLGSVCRLLRWLLPLPLAVETTAAKATCTHSALLRTRFPFPCQDRFFSVFFRLFFPLVFWCGFFVVFFCF